jgi:hypothetical protein
LGNFNRQKVDFHFLPNLSGIRVALIAGSRFFRRFYQKVSGFAGAFWVTSTGKK